MGHSVQIYGFIKSETQDEGWLNFQVDFGDIYIAEYDQWIKKSSPDAETVFFRLGILEKIKHFSFYTMTEQTQRWKEGNSTKLADLFDYKGKRSFQMKVIAADGSSASILKCTGVTPVHSVLSKTPSGTVQSYAIKYSDAKTEMQAVRPRKESLLHRKLNDLESPNLRSWIY